MKTIKQVDRISFLLQPCNGNSRRALCGFVVKSKDMLLSNYATRALSIGPALQVSAKLDEIDISPAVKAPVVKMSEVVVQESFKNLNLRKSLLNSLEELNIKIPTEIQAKGIPEILSGKNVFLASHTGSGKTLAYLLPIVHKLKDEESRNKNLVIKAKRPRALVLGPTRELTDQILQVAKSLSHHARFSSMLLNAANRLKAQKHNLAQAQDLVVATPSRLLEHLEAGNIFLGDIKYMVLDEADTMFDEGFSPKVKKIIAILKRKQVHCQFVMVAATMTKEVKKLVEKEMDNVEIVKTATLHKSVKGSKHIFFTLKPGQDKLQLLHEVLEKEVKGKRRIMVFCNTVSSCRAVEHNCRERGINTMCYHGEVPKEDRKDIIEEFSNVNYEYCKVLICTDIAARGLDIPGTVDHIINFDFPTTSVDYIHRSGRTARAGAQGIITSLLTGKDRILGDRIRWAVYHGLALDDLSGNKFILPPSMKKEKSEEQKKVERARESIKGLRGEARIEALKERSKKVEDTRRLHSKINKIRIRRKIGMLSKKPISKNKKIK